jgi:ferredoxin-NADP reductase
MKVKIIKIDPITHDVKGFAVEKPKGYKFTPGQATEVSINKKGWEDKKRPFTFTSVNTDSDLGFIIKGYPLKKYPNHTGVTEAIHKLKVGDELILGDPWGTINYRGKGTFIAGGSGVTPFIAIFRQLASGGEISGNRLLFSNKTKRDVILEEELRKTFPKDDLILTLTQQEDKNFEKGRIDKSFLKKYLKDLNSNFYVCGPKKMVGDIKEILSEMGASIDSVVFEK